MWKEVVVTLSEVLSWPSTCPEGLNKTSKFLRIACLPAKEPSTYVGVLLTGPCRLMTTRNYDFYCLTL